MVPKIVGDCMTLFLYRITSILNLASKPPDYSFIGKLNGSKNLFHRLSAKIIETDFN